MDSKQFKAAQKYGYRSGLEITVKDYLSENKVAFRYEAIKIEWEDLMYRTYTPDFIMDNGIIIEVKGRFTADDRRKHLEIKKQHPTLDIRFVFESSKRKLSKGSKTTYAQWCEKHKFMYHDRIVPLDWIKEKGVDSHAKLIHLPYEKIKRS
jgi:hypothetical protein